MTANVVVVVVVVVVLEGLDSGEEGVKSSLTGGCAGCRRLKERREFLMNSAGPEMGGWMVAMVRSGPRTRGEPRFLYLGGEIVESQSSDLGFEQLMCVQRQQA